MAPHSKRGFIVLIIGERINATRKRINEAVLKRDADLIREEARKQVAAGAHVLDVNGGVAGREVEVLSWLVGIVQEVADVPLCLDSADPAALAAALPLCRQTPMINSITNEAARFEAVLPLVLKHRARIIALCMSPEAPPADVEDRVTTAKSLVGRLEAAGVPEEDIYVDPCVFPISTGNAHGPAVMDAVTRIRSLYPKAHTSCGVSNVSFGLPARKLLNEVFLMMLLGRGLDTAIIDPCDEGLLARILAAEALNSHDDYCQEYLQAYRGGKLPAAPPTPAAR
jgi:5-methyltetrahydrofolate--homocysteine methyltransferase